MEQQLTQIAKNVWIFPSDDDPQVVQPNVGVVRAASETILIDAGNSPHQARLIQAALDTLGVPPVSTIVYTHHHWDRVFGAIEFDAPRIIGHKQCGVYLEESAAHQWNPAFLREETYSNPLLESRNAAINRLIDDWQSFRIIPPTLTFSQSLTLYLDDLTLQLEHIGGPHSTDSILIRVVESGVTFIGDVLEPAPSYDRPRTEGIQLSGTLLDQILGADGKIFIDGYSTPMSRATMQQIVDNLKQQMANEEQEQSSE